MDQIFNTLRMQIVYVRGYVCKLLQILSHQTGIFDIIQVDPKQSIESFSHVLGRYFL